MKTDPRSFSDELTRINTANNYNIKKVIRLLKAWNAKAGYPIESYTLEQEITRCFYYYSNSTLEDYFFAAIDDLSTYRYGNATAGQKVQALKDNAQRVKAYLQLDNVLDAYSWLAHILPSY
jgi:hypothetical protein